MIDARCWILLIVLILLICVISNNTPDRSLEDSKTGDASKIVIDDTIYQKMLDAVTYYSLMSNDYDEKLIMIYLSTFHLFDMNYSYVDVKALDDSLEEYPAHGLHITFPVGNMHHNIQKAIITHIAKNIDASERELTNDPQKDRQIIDIYLRDLFKGMNIMN